MIKLAGMTCFSIESVPLLFPILGRIKKKTDFNKFFVSVSMTAMIFTSIMGCIVYKTMGDKIEKIYFTNLMTEFTSIKILTSLYALSLFLNAPYMAFPLYQIIVEERKVMTKTFDVNIPILHSN
jgi:hypothetical protein